MANGVDWRKAIGALAERQGADWRSGLASLGAAGEPENTLTLDGEVLTLDGEPLTLGEE